jgi:hypothetical protein
MFLSKPSKIKNFSEKHLLRVGIHKTRILCESIMGILLCNGKRTFEALSKVFVESEKNKTSVRSFF